MVDVGKLSAEQRKQILKFGDDGFNEKELKKLGLTAEEAERLYKTLSGTLDAPTDTYRPHQNAQANGGGEQPPQQKSSNWLPIALGVLGGVLCFTPAQSIGVLLLAGAFLTSCEGGDVYIEGNSYEGHQTANITLTQDSGAADILKWLEQEFGSVPKDLSEIKKVLAQILINSELMVASMDNILLALERWGIKQDQILAAIQVNNENQEKILNAMAKGKEEIKALLEKIVNAVQANGEICKNNGELLNQILDKLKTTTGEEAINLLKEILTQVVKNVEATVNGNEQNKDMDEKTHLLLKTILENLQGFNADFKTGVAAIIAKLDDLNANQREFFEKLISKLDELGRSGEDNIAKILKAIGENTEVAIGTYGVAIKILESLGKLNDKGDKALEVLSNLSIGNFDIDLEDLKAFLKDYFVVMIDTYKGGNQEVINKLNEILNKIPECKGCKCDISELLAKLDIIITKLEKTEDPKHEGVLDDLDNLLK